MSEYVDWLEEVVFVEAVDLGSPLPGMSVFNTDDGISAIQARGFGVRILFETKGKQAVLVPWSNIYYAKEAADY